MNLWSYLTFLWPHVLTVGGFALALLVVANLFRERRSPSVTFAWLVAIVFVPYVGVPLYFIFGGRKNRRLVQHKKEIAAAFPDAQHLSLGGHNFKLLPTGQSTLETLLHHIQNAQHSIDITTYILGNDNLAQKIIKALIARAQHGIRVRVLVDALGSFWLKSKFLKSIQTAGGEAVRFLPALPFQTETSANLRNHRKIAIFDDARAIIGGQNLDERFLGQQDCADTFADFSALIEGPAVRELEEIFLMDWCFATKKPLPMLNKNIRPGSPNGQEWVQTLASGPDVEGDPLWEKLLHSIQQAQREILLVTPYFVPDDLLFRSLLLKARNGIHIRIFLPKKSNYWIMDLARQHYLRDLHQAGVKIFLYEPRMLHAKLFLVDDAIGLIGSVNFDVRSLFVNFEVGVFIHSHPDETPSQALAELKNWAESLLPQCTPYQPEEPSPSRRWLEDMAHILAPLL